ncbi:MAG: DUF3078 domain-containing protein [Alistipes sp.]|nr:DUF3078 domain-containing protein [Alistipes sp.]
MKKLLLSFALLGAAMHAEAQFSVDHVEAHVDDVSFRDTLKTKESVDAEYFNLARYKAERAAIRKERNNLEISAGVQGSLTSYNDPWIKTSGGDNAIALTAVFDLKHTFKKNKFSIDTRAIAKFGYNRMKVENKAENTSEGVWFKNQDEFEISTAPKFNMSKNWSYGTIAKFRSQFVNGYKSRTEQKKEHRKSSFMTPGYLDVSLGVTYTCPKPKWPIVVNLSPIALNATFAENDLIRRDNGYAYGIEDPDKTAKYEGGSSIQVDFDRKFGKTEFLRYRTMIYAFYGWISDIGLSNKYSNYTRYREAYAQWEETGKNIKEQPRLPVHPIVRWTNTIDIKATKYLTTQINFELYYNRAQHVDVMTKTLLSVGLTYTFKNK